MKFNARQYSLASFSVLIALSGTAHSATTYMEARNDAMGGTGVASSHYGTAALANPALLTHFGASDDFSLILPSVGAQVSTVTEPEVFRRTRNRFNQWLQTEFDRHYHTMRDGGYRSFLKKNHPTELERYDEACEALRREEFARFAELQTLGLYLHLQVQQKEAQFRRRRNRLLLGMTITGVMTSVLLYANFYPEQLQLISHELATLPGRISGFVGRLLH